MLSSERPTMNRQTVVGSAVLLLSSCVAFAGGPPNASNSQDSRGSSSSRITKRLESVYSRTPKAPFPYHLRSEISASNDMQYNAVVKIIVNRGKVVNVIPSGGDAQLSNYLNINWLSTISVIARAPHRLN